MADEPRKEARERFDRGVRLFGEGNNAGALAELERANAIAPNPVALYTIALVLAAMQRPVDAVERLDRLLASPGTLGAAELERARVVREEQAARIGEIAITGAPENATLEIDGLPAGKASAVARVASGEHVVTVLAPGFAPLRSKVTVAGRARADVAAKLTPMEGLAAHVGVRSSVPAADVLIDGELAGKTPLPATLALRPGAHRLEVRRRGYGAVAREITLGEGATGEVDLSPPEDPADPFRGTLVILASEPGAQLTVDGASRGVVTLLELPAGVHRVRVEHAGFLPADRDVEVDVAGTTVKVHLEATPEHRDAYVAHAKSQRTWGVAAVIAGGALVAGGGAFLVYNAKVKRDRQSDLDALLAASTPDSGGRCDPRAAAPATCATELAVADDALKSAKNKDVFGWVPVGFGAVSLGVGVYLLVTGGPRVMPWVGPGGGGVSGAFLGRGEGCMPFAAMPFGYGA
jgi:hypothetical protein